MVDWRPILHPQTGRPLLNESGIPKIYDADLYPNGPPCCCGESPCPCCNGSTPASWDVTISGVGPLGKVDGCCNAHNATFNLPWTEPIGVPYDCWWYFAFYSVCGVSDTSIELFLTCNESGIVLTVVVTNPLDTASFSKTFPPGTKCSEMAGDIPFQIQGGAEDCDFTGASCTIAVAP